jgi:seryl-tRNA synthetase
MRKVRFGTHLYDLVDHENVNPSYFQATVYKGTSSVDEIAEATKTAPAIYIYNDDELVAQYEGYTTPVAFSLGYDDNNDAIVSIEMNNTNVLGQIANIQATVNQHSEEIASIDAGVSDLAEEQATQAEYIGSIDAGIADLADEVAELEETQMSQDAAIEDLAAGMAEMMEG